MNSRFGLERHFNSFDESSFTLFVDNLPYDVGPNWFRSFFANFGAVKRSFIPNKVSKRSGCRFGFITFGSRVEANLAIAKSNGIQIDNRNLFVKMASFSKNPNPRSTQIPNPPPQPQPIIYPHHPKPYPIPESYPYPKPHQTVKPKSYAEILKSSSEKTITIKVQPIASSWLSNCSVVKLKSPSTPEVVLEALQLAVLQVNFRWGPLLVPWCGRDLMRGHWSGRVWTRRSAFPGQVVTNTKMVSYLMLVLERMRLV